MFKTFHAIQHIPTGQCLPELGSRKGRGGYTGDEPDGSFPPRMFTRSRDAAAALRWWLQGHAQIDYDYETGDILGIRSSSVEGRNSEDMRIIQVTMAIPAGNK